MDSKVSVHNLGSVDSGLLVRQKNVAAVTHFTIDRNHVMKNTRLPKTHAKSVLLTSVRPYLLKLLEAPLQKKKKSTTDYGLFF